MLWQANDTLEDKIQYDFNVSQVIILVSYKYHWEEEEEEEEEVTAQELLSNVNLW